jgi:hypothetical protein
LGSGSRPKVAALQGVPFVAVMVTHWPFAPKRTCFVPLNAQMAPSAAHDV